MTNIVCHNLVVTVRDTGLTLRTKLVGGCHCCRTQPFFC